VNFFSSAFSGNKRGYIKKITGNSFFFLDFESFLFSLVKEDYNNKQINTNIKFDIIGFDFTNYYKKLIIKIINFKFLRNFYNKLL
jgi:hypothetical protein